MASPSDDPLKRLIGEIHRRSLWQVLGVVLTTLWPVWTVQAQQPSTDVRQVEEGAQVFRCSSRL